MKTSFGVLGMLVALGFFAAITVFWPLGDGESVGSTLSVAPSKEVGIPAANVEQRRSAPVANLVGPLVQRLEKEPNDPSGWALLGKSYDYMGQRKLAADAYRQALEYGSADPTIPKALKDAEDAFMLGVLTGKTPPSIPTRQRRGT